MCLCGGAWPQEEAATRHRVQHCRRVAAQPARLTKRAEQRARVGCQARERACIAAGVCPSCQGLPCCSACHELLPPQPKHSIAQVVSGRSQHARHEWLCLAWAGKGALVSLLRRAPTWSQPAAKSVGSANSGAMSPVSIAPGSTSSTASYCVSPKARSLSQLCGSRLRRGEAAGTGCGRAHRGVAWRRARPRAAAQRCKQQSHGRLHGRARRPHPRCRLAWPLSSGSRGST